MKTIFITTLFMLTAVSVAQQPPKPATTATKTLTRAEFEKLLAKPENLLIIDVRRPDEVTSIGGFPVYLSIQIDDLEKSLAWIPKDRTIVTVSNHSTRSGKAAEFLASKGFKIAGTIGAQNYEEEGGRLQKIVAPVRSETANGVGKK